VGGCPRVLVLLAESFEEIEAVTPIDVLRRAGAQVVVASLSRGPVRGARGVSIVPDLPLDDLLELPWVPFEAVVLPGGMPGAQTLGEDGRVGRLLEGFMLEGRWIAAICAAPAMVLQKHGLIGDRPATCHPSMKDRLPAWVDRTVVVSGKLITSQGPGTAMEFALTLVRNLCGDEIAQSVAASMIVRS
jgi:4-methyl-5(b-hydroxyethyl)-thiazole monophosphate biosynthesis